MIQKGEWRWVWIFAAAVMLATSLPYLYGFQQSGDSGVFSGFLIGVEDGNSYIAKMVRGSAGDWLFTTPYTAYPQKGSFVFFPYLLLGKLATGPALYEQLVVLFHLFRIVAGFFSVSASYFFISVFIHDIAVRKFGLIILTLGGGLGWLLILLGQANWLGSPPLELFSPETFGFLELFAIPHLSLARGLLLCGLSIYLVSAKSRKAWLPGAVLTGVIFLVLGTIQPATLAAALLLMGLHALITGFLAYRERSRKHESIENWLPYLKAFCVAALMSGPFLLYSTIQFNLDPILRTWLTQNILTSPHPLHYLAAFGLVLPFACIGVKHQWRTEYRNIFLLLIIWIICLPILAYAPISVQRRLPEGIWAAWVILAMSIFDRGSNKALQRWKPLLLLTLPSTILIFAIGFVSAGSRVPPIFIPEEQTRAFTELSELSRPDDVVLSSYETGNRLPAWAPLRVVIGHGPESANLSQLEPRVNSFFSGADGVDEQQALLTEFSIDYIAWGPAEKALGSWRPSPQKFQLVVQGEYAFYKVLHVLGE